MTYILKELTPVDQDKILADIQKSNDNYMQKKVARFFDVHQSQLDKTDSWMIRRGWAINAENDSYLLRDPVLSLQFLTKTVYCFYYNKVFYQLIKDTSSSYYGPFMVVNTTKEITYYRVADIPQDLKTAISEAFHAYGEFGMLKFKRMSLEQIKERLAHPVIEVEFMDYSVAEHGYFG